MASATPAMVVPAFAFILSLRYRDIGSIRAKERPTVASIISKYQNYLYNNEKQVFTPIINNYKLLNSILF
ncbi:MAG: hypothetical protein DI539_03485 [Flavobacterium psychrophilum]|nr:MAG: hypothetical protein DI539_03485 [Flavobacterium psychrophilum]